DDEFRLLREFSERASALAPEVRQRLATRLAEKFADHYPSRAASPESFLAELYRDELARRRGRFGARGEPRATERRGQATVAERMAARKTERWQTFQSMADRAAREGLDSFNARELPDFAARYREVAADLARARTYRADSSTLARLERLVVSGHNALYRDERNSINRISLDIGRSPPISLGPAPTGPIHLRSPGWNGWLSPDTTRSTATSATQSIGSRSISGGRRRSRSGPHLPGRFIYARPVGTAGCLRTQRALPRRAQLNQSD